MTKPGFSFLCQFYVVVYFLLIHVCFCCVCVRFSVLSQEIGRDERFTK